MACVRKWRGNWVVDWRDMGGKRHIEAVKGCREAAEGRLAEIIKTGKKPINNKQTFDEYAKWWLENCAKGNIKDSTLAEYEAVLKNHVYPVFGSWPLTKITRRMVREFITQKKNTNLTRSTIKNILSPVRAIYNQGIEDDELQVNPASKFGKFNKRDNHSTCASKAIKHGYQFRHCCHLHSFCCKPANEYLYTQNWLQCL